MVDRIESNEECNIDTTEPDNVDNMDVNVNKILAEMENEFQTGIREVKSNWI